MTGRGWRKCSAANEAQAGCEVASVQVGAWLAYADVDEVMLVISIDTTSSGLIIEALLV